MKSLTLSKNSVAKSLIIIGISSMPVIFYCSGEALVTLQLAYLLYLGGVCFFVPKVSFSQSAVGILFSFVYFFVGLFSIFWNVGAYEGGAALVEFVNLLNATFLLLSGVFLFSALCSNQFSVIFERIAVLVSLFLLFALFVHWDERLGDRFNGNGIHPNWWGSIAYGVACCALLSRRAVIFRVLTFFALFVCYQASSRGSVLGVLLIVLLMMDYKAVLRHPVASILVLLGGVFALFVWGAGVLDFVLNDVFEFNNQYRGAGTGFTGREDGWADALNVIVESPFFGAGYGSLPGLHNGYLIFFAEMGLLGGAAFIALLIAFFRAKGVQKELRVIALSYFVFMMFAPRTFNLVLGSLVPTLCIMGGLINQTAGRMR